MAKNLRSGFTLIELLVTTLILVMASAIVVISFREPIERARFESFCHKLIDFDERARRAAIATNHPAMIRFDLSRQQIAISRWNQGAMFWQTYSVPYRIKIESLTLIDGKHSDKSVLIPVSTTGTTSSYAIEISNGTRQKWIIIIGGSGQSYEAENEIEVQSTFGLFRQIGADTR